MDIHSLSIYTLIPVVLVIRVYILGRPLMPMLQLSLCVGGSKGKSGMPLKCTPEKWDTTEMHCRKVISMYINF